MPNHLAFSWGIWHPPVNRVRREKPGQPPTPFFRWRDGAQWHQGDELPDHIARALPGPLWDACESHRSRRIAFRRAA